MRFIDKYFYMILLLFIVFLLFALSFWNIFIVPLQREISTDLSGLMAQEERILYTFFESPLEQNQEKNLFKKQKKAELKKTYMALFYNDKELWLKSQSFCKLEYEFMHNAEKKFFDMMHVWFILFISFLSLQLANKVCLKDIFNNLILLVITTVLLIYVDSSKVDDKFYTLMRTAVFLTSLYFVYGLRVKIKTNLFFWLFLIVAIVFNPIFPVIYEGCFCSNINLYTAIIFIIYFVVLCWQNRKFK
ncbi:MAG: hypothetical protein PHR82_00905 [Endomicrobiaceae bacterium]|nr:hypothetical protein [Endomicrobiaceae bacterium]